VPEYGDEREVRREPPGEDIDRLLQRFVEIAKGARSYECLAGLARTSQKTGPCIAGRYGLPHACSRRGYAAAHTVTRHRQARTPEVDRMVCATLLRMYQGVPQEMGLISHFASSARRAETQT
jgi:hypothetical protein